MTELEQAIAAIEPALSLLPITTHDTQDYCEATGPNFQAMTMDRAAFEALNHLPAVMDALRATGQLVPAQEWRPIETMPDCVNVLVWARGWGNPSIGFIGFTSDGVGPYDPISGGAFDPRPTHWMPIPPPPAENVK